MKREILGIYNQPTESASNWKDMFEDLKDRGLKQCNLMVSDNLSGINSTIELQFEGIKIQQCVLHLKRNVFKKIKMKHRKEVTKDLAAVFDMDKSDDSKEQAFKRAKEFSEKWSKFYPHLKKFSDENEIRYYFTYLDYDFKIWRMIYTTNWIERLNKDFKRTTKIRNSMPSVKSVLTLLRKVAINKNAGHYNYPIYNFSEDSLFQ
jgi:transposase-like protein